MSTEPWQNREDWHDVVSVLNGNNVHPRRFYRAMLSFRREGGIKGFQDTQKLKEFMNTKPAML